MKLKELLELKQTQSPTHFRLIKGQRIVNATLAELSDKIKNLEVSSFNFLNKGNFRYLEVYLTEPMVNYCDPLGRFSIGHNQYIGSKWIPIGEPTGLVDCNGVPLFTSDCVTLNGCSSHFAYVGLRMEGGFGLFFGSKFGSVGWDLDQKSINDQNILKFC